MQEQISLKIGLLDKDKLCSTTRMECSKRKDCWKKQKPGDGSLCHLSNFDGLPRIFPLRTFEAKREVQFRLLVPWEYTSRWWTRLPHTLKITVDWCPWRKKKKSSSGENQLSLSSLPPFWRIFSSFAFGCDEQILSNFVKCEKWRTFYSTKGSIYRLLLYNWRSCRPIFCHR